MKVFQIIMAVWLIFFGTAAGAAYTKNHRSVAPSTVIGSRQLAFEVNNILQNVDSKAVVGVYIKSMQNGENLYKRNEQQPLKPASIMKLLVAEAALLYLGPDYKFPTTLLTDAQGPHNGVISGNLYLVQTGDPSLTFYDFNDLMVSLKSEAVQRVAGNVYIDTTAYDDAYYGPGWIWNDKRYCYAAPISASIINKNCLSFKVVPAKNVGKLAAVVQNPRYYYGLIQNAVLTKRNKARGCGGLQINHSGEVLSLAGCMPKGNYAWGVSTVISDIKHYNQSMLVHLFKQYGIQVDGKVMPGEAPSNLRTVASHESKSLSLLINDMLKKSDNVIAGSLLKKLGEFYARQPGSWQNGGEAVKRILFQKADVDSMQMSVLDGSGLSLDNRVKAAQMMQVLNFAYHNEATNYEFLSALPIAGVDGTLKYRLSNVKRKVRAKTGTASKSGIVSLAGYVMSHEKEPIAFVIIFNGSPGNVWKYREMEDKIVTALTRYSRSERY